MINPFGRGTPSLTSKRWGVSRKAEAGGRGTKNTSKGELAEKVRTFSREKKRGFYWERGLGKVREEELRGE